MVLIHTKRFMGFACNISDLKTFKVIYYNTDPHKSNMVVHIGVVVSHKFAATGCNYAISPNRNVYLPEVHIEGVPPIKPTTPGHQRTVNPPNFP